MSTCEQKPKIQKKMIRDIKDGISNFWKYRKIIWNDRWWDYGFTLKLIRFKLNDNIQNWDKSHYVGCNFTKKRMIVLLKRIDEFEDKIEELQNLYFIKLISKDEYRKKKNKIIHDCWYSLGRNIQRFWD